MADSQEPRGLIPAIVRTFLRSRITPLLLAASLLMGVAAVLLTPREEEPQIVVPMADVHVQAPGASAAEIEELVTAPLERILWQIDGVEHVYSVSRRDSAAATVRFFVGEDREDSLIKLHNAIQENLDLVPDIVGSFLVKPVEIDDVPIVSLTLSSDRYGYHDLRRIAEELYRRLAEVENISRISLVSGLPREVRVDIHPDRLAGYDLTPLMVFESVKGSDASLTAGTLDMANRQWILVADSFLTSPQELRELVVGVFDGKPVHLNEVAEVVDGPAEPENYSRLGYSAAHLDRTGEGRPPHSRPAVTLAVAKKKGTNAVWVAQDVLERVEQVKNSVLPDGVFLEVSRNYGQTAQTKVNDLLTSLIFAVATVVVLLAFTLGWREALVVAVAVPVSFSLALFVNFLIGYTINRVTLFALILSLGLVVDDPITNVDNIQRHVLMRKQKPFQATLAAVAEVLPPVIMSTLAIIVSFLPLFFITGMMGPYMAPMAANVPLTVTFSTVCALTIVPWLAYMLLKKTGPAPGQPAASQKGVPPKIRRFYGRVVGPFLERRLWRWGLLGVILVGLAVSVSLALFRQVPLKMLPFDNKNELQLVIDLPEGSTLENTDRAVRAFEDYLQGVPEVTHFVSYTGSPSPMDFNGMVRHYYWREGANLADIRINFVDKSDRVQQSHAIALRLRKDLQDIADAQGARLKIVETPPGPPVLSTVAVEVYGQPATPYEDLIDAAGQVREVMAAEPFVVDIDDSTETSRDMIDFILDKEKASLHGVDAETVARTLALAVGGASPANMHEPFERQPLPIRLILPRATRSSISDLSSIEVKGRGGKLVPLAEIGDFKRVPVDQPIQHKDLKPVVFVYAELAGRPPGEAILDMQDRLAKDPLPPGINAVWDGEGEWEITLDVFRDLGIAFAAALIGIYILLVVETNSFGMPLLIMTAIPLTLLGIMPGFWLLNVFFAGDVGGFADPIFFTATSMIGMIALGGIVIRNSLVLIDFVKDELAKGASLRDAVLDSGAVRLRPIVLTAATTALGAWPITLDPIFSGLAWALIFGLAASTLFTLLVIPVTYFAFTGRPGQPAPTERERA
ncbi:MAG: efflux RND transporter permease subunit [Desulfovibrionaceae bacterium]